MLRRDRQPGSGGERLRVDLCQARGDHSEHPRAGDLRLRRVGQDDRQYRAHAGPEPALVGGPVFDRPGGPRPVELTPLGRLLLPHAREVLARVDAERFQAGIVGRIDIGTFQSVSTALLPAILGAMKRERPLLEARLVESDDHDDLARRVVEGQLDASFLVDDVRADLEVAELFVDPFVVVALPEAVPDDPVPATSMRNTAVIGQPDNACQRRVDDRLRENGIAPDYVFRANDNSAVLAMVRAGVGMAVLPLLAVELDDPRIAVRRLDPPIPPRRISIGWRGDRTLSPAAKRFIELTQEMTADLRDRELVGSQ